ncbi:TPA: 23S rRNA methyltransferase attenuation leader peptide [Staphylococcus pseudintermedius]|nr:23S rRNA methyltransferase attenuation leader peptide [Staphylococcus pseudintermedius]HCA7833564.1 23S rRNA methyltransferase attenuation leader peptide [Staphylococcus pseudintermedius]
MLVFQMRYQMRYVDKTSTVLKQTKISDYADK